MSRINVCLGPILVAIVTALVGPRGASGQEVFEHHHASLGFSGTQGNAGWFYWYDEVGTQMTHFTSDTWRRSATLDFPQIGELEMTPSDTAPAVRVWEYTGVSDVEISVVGHVVKTQNTGVAIDDIDLRIVRRRNSTNETVWSATLDELGSTTSATNTGGVGHHVRLTVISGDHILFVVDSLGDATDDKVQWDPDIAVAPAPTGDHGASEEFPTTWGGNGWSFFGYNESTASYYNLPYFQQSTQAWFALATGGSPKVAASWQTPRVKSQVQHRSARVWTFQGTERAELRITGRPHLINSGGDGVSCLILKNPADGSGITEIWSRDLASGSTIWLEHDVVTYVSCGDRIEFHVDPGATHAFDKVDWDPRVQVHDPVTVSIVGGYDLEVGRAETIASPEERHSVPSDCTWNGPSLGCMHFWPDGPIGIVSNGNYKFIAPGSDNGIAVTEGPELHLPLDTVVTTSTKIMNGGVPVVGSNPTGRQGETITYAAGGPTFEDPNANDHLYVFYHIEREFSCPPGCSFTPFYSSFGICRSTDGGSTFTDLGEVVQANMSYEEVEMSGVSLSIAMGYGEFVLRTVDDGNSPSEDYFYSYYKEYLGTSSSDQFIAVARAKVSSITGGTPIFFKYLRDPASLNSQDHFDHWQEAGMGGKATKLIDLQSNEVGFIRAMNVAYNTDVGSYVGILARTDDDRLGIGLNRADNLSIRLSTDSLQWGDPGAAGEVQFEDDGGATNYPTIVAIDPAPGTSHETGRSFYVYYRWSPRSDGGLAWHSAELRRRRLHIVGSVLECQSE